MVVEAALGELTVFDGLDPKALSFEGLFQNQTKGLLIVDNEYFSFVNTLPN